MNRNTKWQLVWIAEPPVKRIFGIYTRFLQRLDNHVLIIIAIDKEGLDILEPYYCTGFTHAIIVACKVVSQPSTAIHGHRCDEDIGV
jgi:hypothetical protein